MLAKTKTFPLEIGDTIIDSCSDERAFLKACSLVCTSWARRARYHLFSRIRILVHPHCITPQRLFLENILERDPKVAVYVRYMELCGCFPYGSTVPPTWTGLNGFSLDRFPRLSSIKLNHLSYSSITSLIYLIRQFSFIASLDLDDIRIVPVANAVPLPPRLPTTQRSHDWSLRTLSLRTSSNHDNPPEQRSLAVGLAKTPCLTNLTSLRLHVSPAACGAWAPSLPASLHHSVISINAIFSTERWHVPLQSLYDGISRMYEALRACRALRSLTLVSDRRHTRGGDAFGSLRGPPGPPPPVLMPFFLTSLAELLSHPQGPAFPHLERLNFELQCNAYSLDGAPLAEGWAALALALTAEGRYPTFRGFNIEVHEITYYAESGVDQSETTEEERARELRPLFLRFKEEGVQVDIRVHSKPGRCVGR